MPRTDYLINQKSKLGRHLMAVFPAQYPKEVLWAMNILPVEIWDPPVEVTLADAHLQSFICPVVKLGMELILQGGTGMVDGYLFPHTCDSIQNMASVVYDYLDQDKPCFFFYHPKAPYGQAARDYYAAQIKVLIARLEKHFGPMDPQKFAWAVEQSRNISAMIGELYNRRARGNLDLTNVQFYDLIRRGEWLWPEDFTTLLQATLDKTQVTAGINRTSIILSGVLPNPAKILNTLDDLNVAVAHDDLISSSRRLLVNLSTAVEPMDYLVDTYFNLPPCSTKASSITERLYYLSGLIQKTGAKGVIFYIVKFCETELFDVPNMIKGLDDRKVAALNLDVNLNERFSGALTTRIEAFVEMLG